MDIAAWLRGLGLEQYAQIFRENDIDGGILCGMTAEDLKELGIRSFGHRRRLVNAITALGEEPPTRDVAQSAMSVPPSRPPIDAERRQLTVMFCDLVGSTALSTRHDPEDLREMIGAYHHAVTDTVGRFDGFVAKYMGDGVLIYFGYPQAHEDDAERAVCAGLAVIKAVGRLPAREDLSVRLGIATGLAVVGDLIGEGAAQERGVVGETPNLAARLQALATPNTVIIAEATRRQVGGLFELADLGPQALAGFAEPQSVWRVIGESGMLSRFEALRSGEMPLVGRDEEIELLTRRWQQAKSGEGRVVLISGEPGIGKSRLTAALSEHIESEPHTRLRYFCSPHHQDSALYPFIAQIERAAGFARDDAIEEKLRKLRAMLAPGRRDDADVALFSELLSLPSSAAELNLSPQRKREKLFEALLNQLQAEARHRPVLMVFEDAHWIDPTSRELLDLTVDRVRHLPVLLAITFRPEFQPPWSGRSHVMSLALSRLGEREGEALVQTLAGNDALSAEIVAEIVERTDGVPLFVEELTKAVLEGVAKGDRVVAVLVTTSPAAHSVPATLHASLMARLDRLGPAAKEIAQIGAVLGREFGHELIAPVAQRPEKELQAALDQLGDAGLLFCRGTAPHASYLFKHALVQDAAYSTLLRGRRQELHARVAAALEEHFDDLVERQPELLARHLTEAGLLEKAVFYWQKAGERAAERSANIEAVAHLTRGIEVLGRLPESTGRDEQELLLQAALIAPLAANEGYGSAAQERAASRAVELGGWMAADSPAQPQAAIARGWLADLHMVRGELRTGLVLAEENLDRAVRFGYLDQLDRLVDSGLGVAQFSIGVLHLYLGDLAAARRHLEDALSLCDPERDRAKAARSSTHCHARLGLVLWHQGYPDEALRHAKEAIAAARTAAHPLTEALALSHAAKVGQLRGEVTVCLHWAEATLALATEQVLPFYIARAKVLVGWARVKKGQPEEGLAQLRAGIGAYRAIGAKFEMPHWLALLAEACLETGRIGEGLSAILEALPEVAETAARCHEAELNRLEGELLLASDEPDESRAEASFRKAIEVARAQTAKSWELRAATSLARLLVCQGKREEAHALLAPIYGWFTEGFDTADLKEAKPLLAELG